MDKKKGIVIAVVVLLLLMVGTFAFQRSDEELFEAPSQNQQGDKDNGSNSSESGTDNESTEEEITLPAGNDNQQNGQQTNNNGNVQNPGDKVTVSVEKLKVSIGSGNEVLTQINTTDTELQKLLDELRGVIGEGEQLINNPTVQTEVDQKQQEIDSMIEKINQYLTDAYQKAEEAVKLSEEENTKENIEAAKEIVSRLPDGDKKNELWDRIKDTTFPVITKVKDDSYVNHSVSPKVYDDYLDTVVLTKDGVVVENYQDNMHELSHDGKYVLTATDESGNQTTVEFTIDTTEPSIQVKSSSIGVDGFYSKIDFQLRDNIGLARVIVNDKEYKREGKINDLNFQNVNNYVEGLNTVIVEDLAGNQTTYTFTLDTIAKKVQYAFDGPYHYAKRHDVGVTILEENVKEVYYVFTEYQKEYQVEEIFNNGKAVNVSDEVQNNKFTAVLQNTNGKFYLWTKVVDKAGNVSYTKSSNPYKIDTLVPSITLNGEANITLNYGADYSDAGVIVSDNIKVASQSTTIEYATSENGQWKVVDRVDTKVVGYYKITYLAKDTSGNEASVVRNVRVFNENEVYITNSDELMSAIKNQKDGQKWLIAPGTYSLLRDMETVYNYPGSSQTGFYFAVTANNITIEGLGDVTIQAAEDVATNGSLSSQNFVTVLGDNFTVNHVNFVSQVALDSNEPNKVIEILGNNAVLKNVNVLAPSKSAGFAGSIYVNKAGITTTLENVNLEYGRISLSGANSTNKFVMNNVTADFAGSIREDYYAFYNTNNVQVVANNFTVTVSNKLIENNPSEMETMLNMLPKGTTVVFDDGIYNLGSLSIRNSLNLIGTSKENTILNVDKVESLSGQSAIFITENVTLKNFTINMSDNTNYAVKVSSGKKDASGNLALVESFTINNVIINGGSTGLNIHGVKNAVVNGVTSNSANNVGISVASSNVSISNTNITSGAWGSIAIMYTDGDNSYPIVSEVTIGDNVNIHNWIYTEGFQQGNTFKFTNPEEWQETLIPGSYIKK